MQLTQWVKLGGTASHRVVPHAEINRTERIIFFSFDISLFEGNEFENFAKCIWICFSTSCRVKSRYNQPARSSTCKNKSDGKNDIFSFRTLFPFFFYYFVCVCVCVCVCEKTDLRIHQACLNSVYSRREMWNQILLPRFQESAAWNLIFRQTLTLKIENFRDILPREETNVYFTF